MATAAQMDAHYQRTSIPRNHKLPKPRPIKTLPKLLFLSDPLRQNRYPNPDFAADGSAPWFRHVFREKGQTGSGSGGGADPPDGTGSDGPDRRFRVPVFPQKRDDE